MSTELKADPDRVDKYSDTGIYVRAKTPEGKWDAVDIAELDLPSLKAWLRSRGGDNEWAENTVYLLLGHSSEDVENLRQ